MSFRYEIVNLHPGDTLQLNQGDIMSGSHIAPDGRGGFHIVAHVLRAQPEEIAMPVTKELGQ